MEERDLEADVLEFGTVLGSTLRALKSSMPEPPKELRDALEDLAPRHMPALRLIALSGPFSVSELSVRLGLGLSTTSAIVGHLSQVGLVERSEDEADRRRTIVRLHEDHREMVDAWSLQALGPIRRTFQQLSKAERKRFVEIWQMLHTEAMFHTDPAVQGGDHAESLLD